MKKICVHKCELISSCHTSKLVALEKVARIMDSDLTLITVAWIQVPAMLEVFRMVTIFVDTQMTCETECLGSTATELTTGSQSKGNPVPRVLSGPLSFACASITQIRRVAAFVLSLFPSTAVGDSYANLIVVYEKLKAGRIAVGDVHGAKFWADHTAAMRQFRSLLRAGQGPNDTNETKRFRQIDSPPEVTNQPDSVTSARMGTNSLKKCQMLRTPGAALKEHQNEMLNCW